MNYTHFISLAVYLLVSYLINVLINFLLNKPNIEPKKLFLESLLMILIMPGVYYYFYNYKEYLRRYNILLTKQSEKKEEAKEEAKNA